MPEEGVVIGSTLKEDDIRTLCEELKPDFIQIDCKGHAGWASYPTTIGNAMPEFDGDPLAMWRKVTREYGIGLYMHYSGVYEMKYCAEHPDQAVSRPDGSWGDAILLDGRYADDVLIPQITELAEKYGIDGVWIDGDCWYARADFRPETITKFEQETGIDLQGNIPIQKGDPYFEEYLDFTREQYRTYLRHYVDTLHERFPNLQICSNWAFSDYMPEPVTADMDFLSGDCNPQNSFNSARYAARYIAHQNKPWDLMAWGFRFQAMGTTLFLPKSSTQLMQEAASVISLGGAFQIYMQQYRDGSPNVTHWLPFKDVAEFMQARKPYCFGGKQVHQAGLLIATADRRAELIHPYSREGAERLIGTSTLLCDAGQAFEIVSEHSLEGHYDEFPMIVVPELYAGLTDDTTEKLRKYVENGGNLLLIGTNTAQFFADKGFPFSVSPTTCAIKTPNNAYGENGHAQGGLRKSFASYFTPDGKHFGLTVGACRIAADNATPIATLHCDTRSTGEAFAQVFSMGRGKIAVIASDIGSQYDQGAQYLHRTLLNKAADALYTPLVRVEHACGLLEIVPLEKDRRLMVQLVNGNGNHAAPNNITDDQLPPVVDITLSIATDTKPKRLVLQPEGRELEFSYCDGRAYVEIDRVNIHNVVEVVE